MSNKKSLQYKVKVRVKDEEHCAEVQAAFREMGFDWEAPYYKNQNMFLNSEFIYADPDTNCLYCSVWEEYNYMEVSLEAVKAGAVIRQGFADTTKEIEAAISRKEETVLPVLGLTPKCIHVGERIKEITGAINRFVDVSMPIPPEWVEELSELIQEAAYV